MIILNVNKVAKNYGFGDVLKEISFTLNEGEKVALLGKNGCGKSTLIKHILNGVGESNGICKLATNQKVGYLSQIIEFYDSTQTVLWTYMNELGFDEQKARSILYNFQFYKKDWSKTVKSLSGGEKLRLKLAIILQSKINLIILDEPTNHIDITTREVLEESLKNFNGTIIFISHDRYFINKIATK